MRSSTPAHAAADGARPARWYAQGGGPERNEGAVVLALSIIAVYLVIAAAPSVFSVAGGLRIGDSPLTAPAVVHPLGTDALGRDVWTRLVHGARTSLAVGSLAALLSMLTGLLFGWAAAAFSGWRDDLLMRTAEIIDSIPALLLALLLVAAGGPGLLPLALVIGFTGWLAIARLVRTEVLMAREANHVVAARALGAARWRLALRHIAPEVLVPVLALLPFRMEGAIVVEAGLSFLGVEDATRPSWGSMLRDAQPHLLDAWWLVAPPIIAISLLVFALSLLSDRLQHGLDPRLEAAMRSERRSAAVR
ncbi:MAG: ABC transporter permease [Gemmatimonadota bacterium]